MATVAAHKVCQNTEVFTEIMIASRTKKKCDSLADVLNKKYGTNVQTAQVDADSVEQLVELLGSYKPEIVMNLALPYQDLTIMEACLQTGCNYLDTANYEPKDEPSASNWAASPATRNTSSPRAPKAAACSSSPCTRRRRKAAPCR